MEEELNGSLRKDKKWLGSRDSNPDSMIQSHVSYQLDDFPEDIIYSINSNFYQD